jgi:hypothetical protein
MMAKYLNFYVIMGLYLQKDKSSTKNIKTVKVCIKPKLVTNKRQVASGLLNIE